MPITAISSHAFQPLQQTPVIDDPRRLAKQDEDNPCFATAAKVFAVVGTLLASIIGFSLFGPLAGLVVTLVAGVTAAWLLNSYNQEAEAPHYHSRAPQAQPHAQPHVVVGGGHLQQPTPRPWYHFFSTYPTNNEAPHVPVRGSHPGEPHVGVGGGHFQTPSQPHIGVGRGHIDPPEPTTPWYSRIFSAIPTDMFMSNPPHVGVGRGHGGQPHVIVGNGHNPPQPQTVPVPGHGRGGVTQPPPPSGPGGHVPVGHGQRRS